MRLTYIGCGSLLFAAMVNAAAVGLEPRYHYPYLGHCSDVSRPPSRSTEADFHPP